MQLNGAISPKNCAVHAVLALHFWYACYYDLYYVNVPVEVHRMGSTFFGTSKLKYLTFWGAIAQAAFFTICLLNDVIGTNEEAPRHKPIVRLVKDTMLAAVAFPLAMLVGTTFWLLYLIDRELIFPKALDAFFPTWLNHAMHTNIIIFIVIEMFLSFRKYPKRKIGFGILSAVLLTYLVWIHIIYAYSGIWVYPFLEVLNLPLRIVFFISMLGISYSVYVLGEKLNTLIWSKALNAIDKSA